MELGIGNWTANLADGTHQVQAVFGTERLNQWVFLTAVVDRSAGLFKAYTDGSLVASVSLGRLGSVSSSSSAYIGGISGYGFNGTIDEVMIYNRALASTEVAALYNQRTGTTIAVSISPASASLPTDGTLQFAATVTGTTDTSVIWSATGGAVSSLGLYTAPAAAGIYTVKATSLADATKSASVRVTVSSITGTNRYLGVSGSDVGSCTNPTNPCRTFNYVDSRSASGDVVHVLPGTYNLTPATCIVTNTSGVTWQSDAHGAATINGGGHCLYMWHNTGSSGYLRILGFQFTGVQVNSSLNSFGVLLEGSNGNFEVAYNTFHDFGGSNPSNNFGAALSPAPYGGGGYTGRTCSVHDNVFRNIAPGGSFLYNGYSIYAVCGNKGGDPDPRIYNNLIYNEGSFAIQMWHAADHTHVYNNTIDQATMGILAGVGDQGAVNEALFDISNNIVSNSHYGIYAEDGSGYTLSPNSTFDNNLIYNNAIDWAYNNNGTTRNILTSFQNANEIKANPLYVNPGTGTYVLGATSPAIGTGQRNGYSPTLDLRGVVRPNPPSIGGFER